jgi:hypothetical protein
MAKLYRCSVGLPPENDSTRDARLTAEAQANSPDSTAEEKAEARKRLETLRKRAWDDARAGFDGTLKPTDAEFTTMQRRERQLHAMFKGVQDVDD